MDHWREDWCPRDGDYSKYWHFVHDSLSCHLFLSALALERSRPADLAHYQRHLLRLSLRMFEEALKFAGLTHMTHRGNALVFGASILLKLSDRRDLVLRVALRMAGDATRPYVPTFVRSCGCQMLAMLW